MRKSLIVLLFTFSYFVTLASHITGGEMIYEYVGPGSQSNTRTFRITLKLFRDQRTTGAPMPQSVFIGLFNNDNDSQFPGFNQPFTVPINQIDVPVKINPYPPCVVNAVDLEYNVGYYSLTIELPVNNSGYTASYQTCCRINPLNNVLTANGTGGTGSTYSCIIPAIIDNSPSFEGSIDLICYEREFTLDFSATDIDGDSLVYSFAEAYNGGSAANANNINPAKPPYRTVDYSSAFSSETPLGAFATINSLTGVISGIAPGAGRYVVCVSVRSYKNKKFVGEHRKDFIVNVGDCELAGALLRPKPVVCNTFEVSFSNDDPSPLNKTIFWEFGDPASGVSDTSSLANPTHKFTDTGVYVYKLFVNRGLPCPDSSTQIIKIYPGFFPGFSSAGQCKNTPISFTNTSTSTYGRISGSSWDFGNAQQTDDTSRLKDPSYIYSLPGNYDVHLTVTDTKGCTGTATVNIQVTDKADFAITNDTLICSVDTLQLNAEGAGTFFWTPNYNINNQNGASPLVSPDVPTRYYANFSDSYGCEGRDSVFVNVKSFVTINAGNDTNICSTDAIVLKPLSDALHYKWAPSATLNFDTLKNPVATPLTTTAYTVTGSIGRCQSTDALIVKVAPYPRADAGRDTGICLGNSIQLSASGGTLYKWSPGFFLDDPDIPNPVANPVNNIRYAVTVSDTLGCPKSVSDSVVIQVVDVVAEAGPSDTSVVVNQPLQLNASGAEFYLWTPAVGLSDPTINNPVARLSSSQQYVLTVNQFNCFDTDTINITVYKIEPGLYVPNAFTPGGDGRNDVLRPVPIGIRKLAYFRVFNRWGKLMFSSSSIGQGWDGTYKGKGQDSGVYVWMLEGTDYQDKKISEKGSVVLIR